MISRGWNCSNAAVRPTCAIAPHLDLDFVFASTLSVAHDFGRSAYGPAEEPCSERAGAVRCAEARGAVVAGAGGAQVRAAAAAVGAGRHIEQRCRVAVR